MKGTEGCIGCRLRIKVKAGTVVLMRTDCLKYIWAVKYTRYENEGQGMESDLCMCSCIVFFL